MSNNLKGEPSRYLAQHADNPVSWHPWGDDAFALARETGKPLLVSIGYSSCHWCHVMAHESFEDSDTADLINELYVPVKVDKEEYPDVDGYYMAFLNQLTGSGGWPLNVLVNPHRAPFFGFTYLPTDRLVHTLRYARTEYDREERMRDQRIQTSFSQRPVTLETIRTAVSNLRFDSYSDNSGPQFPQAPYLSLAIQSGDHGLAVRDLELLLTRGLYDHIEGGWFRYTVDPDWKIPHFEKMLYDQATLIDLCADACAIRPDLSSYAVSGAVRWLTDSMRLPNGLYGSATDADTEEGEGAYYTFDEISSQEEVSLFRLTDCGRHEGRYQPWIDIDFLAKHPDTGESLINERRDERAQRLKPGLDTKAVFSWNAYLGFALAKYARAAEDESVARIAERLRRALAKLPPGDLPHVIYESGVTRGYRYLEDYAAWLLFCSIPPRGDRVEEGDSARIDALLDAVEEHFVHDGSIWHTDRREFESQTLWQDTPFPSGGSMLLEALVRLDRTDHPLFELLLTNIVEVAVAHPVFFPVWIRGFKRYFDHEG